MFVKILDKSTIDTCPKTKQNAKKTVRCSSKIVNVRKCCITVFIKTSGHLKKKKICCSQLFYLINMFKIYFI